MSLFRTASRPMLMGISFAVVFAAGVGVLSSCAEPGGVGWSASGGGARSAGASDPLAIRGKEVFGKYCATCHGDTGDGAGEFAHLMNPRPRNLQEGKFRLATTENQIPSDDDLLSTITSGMPGSSMPPWEFLPLADRQALVRYVRQLHIDGARTALKSGVDEGAFDEDELPELLAERTVPGPPLVVPPEPPFDDARWFRGRRIYMEACASCHGADGQPVSDAVKTDDNGFPLPPRSFVRGIFKGGSEGAQLHARIVKGMTGTPMPGYEESYSGDDAWDLIHYVQSLARAGAQERARLRQETITVAKVRGSLPAEPGDGAWDQASPVYLALTPLWWAEDRIEGLMVRALHDGQDLALRLDWIDPTANERAVGTGEFSDAVAVQFSLTPDPPFYMGGADEHGSVSLWYWRADRQKNLTASHQDVDVAFPDRAIDRYAEQKIKPADVPTGEWPRGSVTAHDPEFITAWGAGNLVADPGLKTSTESLVARGLGTVSGRPVADQSVQGRAAYEQGAWSVQLRRSLKGSPGSGGDPERTFQSGDSLPVAFAVWDGSTGDRGGKKNISIWQTLVIK